MLFSRINIGYSRPTAEVIMNSEYDERTKCPRQQIEDMQSQDSGRPGVTHSQSDMVHYDCPFAVGGKAMGEREREGWNQTGVETGEGLER